MLKMCRSKTETEFKGNKGNLSCCNEFKMYAHDG
jgi:hypothetical protein